MSKRSDLVALRQMLTEAEQVNEFLEGRELGELETDRELQYAVVKALENIGESATRVSKSTQQKYPDIEWSEIVSFRNRLTHAYDQLDLGLVREVIKDDLPLLTKRLAQAIADLAG